MELNKYAEQGTDEENRTKDADTRTDSYDKGTTRETVEENGNKSRISETLGKEKRGLRQDRSSERQHRNEHINGSKIFRGE